MPRISPFPALRYTDTAGKAALLIAPPYDVIDPAEAAALRERSPYNAVRLVLPEEEGEARYAAAADRLAAWRRDGILARDPAPAVYAYRQRYERDGRPLERLALFGALELEEPGDGVLAHERTHAGPKRDRLALTVATRTQLSPIFLLARDPEASLLEALRAVVVTAPDVAARTPDGIDHALWVVHDEGAAAVLCALAGRRPLLIADGHHRYETALEAARRLGGDAARRVLACIVSAEDPGLLISPTHRILTARALTGEELAPAQLPDRLGEWFRVEGMPGLEPDEAETRAAEDPAGMVVLPGNRKIDPFRLRVPAEPKAGADAGSAAAGRIAAVRFDRHVMGDLLGSDADSAARDGCLEYHRDAAEAVRRAGDGGAAFILPPVALEAVWQATSAGVRLPPKSTYFAPKIPSGLLFRPLD